jgi:hypothetical protein
MKPTIRATAVRVVVLACAAALAVLAVPASATAGTARESRVTDWRCSANTDTEYPDYYGGRIFWSNDDGRHLISIDKVVFDYASYRGALVVFDWVRVQVFDGYGNRIRINAVGPDYNRGDAHFFWPQRFMATSSARKVRVSVEMRNLYPGSDCGRNSYFWN